MPLGGSSYIPLPRFLAAKKAIVNLKKDDDERFKWAITRALNSVEEHSERIDKILRISKHNYKRESTVNLLLISDDTKQHYCLIKDISKLLSLQTSKDGHVRHVCFKYLNTFNFEKSFAFHHEYCKLYEAIRIVITKDGSKISF